MAGTDTPTPAASQQPPQPSRSWVQDGTAQPLPTPSEAEVDRARVHLANDAAQQRITVGDAWRSIKAGDFLSVHEAPCSRTGFLTGIGSGAAVGGLRFVLGSGVPKAANWAVGAGVLGAVLSYEFCQASRRREREKMKRVVEVYDRKQAQVKALEEDKRKVRAVQHDEEEAKRKVETKWWKVW